MTDYSNKIQILGSLYEDYRGSQDFEEFVRMNDLGLPLAFHANEGLATLSEKGKQLVEQTWIALLEMIGIDDVGFEDVEELLDAWKEALDEQDALEDES
jgi:hypothetical protein